MACEFYKNLLSSYIDNDINEIDRIELEKHLKTCKECLDEYKLLLSIVRSCNSVEEVELPRNFNYELQDRLKNLSNKKTNKKYLSFNWRWVSGIAAIFIIFIISITQLPNFINKDMEASDESAPGYAGFDSPSVAPDTTPEGENFQLRGNADISMKSRAYDDAATSEEFSEMDVNYKENKAMGEVIEDSQFYDRKIIVNGSISLEVTDLENSIGFITDLTKKYGGYIENSNIDNNSYYYTEHRNEVIKDGNLSIRIPSNKFQSAIDEIKELGELTNVSTNSMDVSEAYYDTATRIENLKIQENRLRELLVLANNIEEILKIENEINRVRNDIDLMSTDIRRWDKQVSMSSLYIYLREVKDSELSSIDVSTSWGKAQKGFVKAVNNLLKGAEILFIFLVTAIPYIIILAAILIVVFIIVKKIKRLKQKS